MPVEYLNISSQGGRGTSSIDTTLARQIFIPRGATNINLSVSAASVWNTVPNIYANLNDTFFLSFAGSSNEVKSEYRVTVPQGQYSVEDLNLAIDREILGLGFASESLVLGRDDPTQRVTFTSVLGSESTGIELIFRGPASMGPILGMPKDSVIQLLPRKPKLADEAARFNNVNAFLLHSPIVGTGIPINHRSTWAIARIPVSAKSGSQITYEPNNPLHISAGHLAATSISRVQAWLTSENPDMPVDTGEDWDFIIRLAWD